MLTVHEGDITAVVGAVNKTIGMLPLLTIIQRTEVEGEGGGTREGRLTEEILLQSVLCLGVLLKVLALFFFSSFLLSSFLSLSLSFFSALKLLCNNLSSAEIPSSTLK